MMMLASFASMRGGAIPITLIPALGVSLWLSKLLGIPYWALAASLLVGQAIAGVVGAMLVNALKRLWKMGE